MEQQTVKRRLRIDRRLLCLAIILGLFFSILTVTGGELRTHGEFQAFSWMNAVMLLVWMLVYGAALYLLFSLANLQANRSPKKESLLGRITGNGFLVFLLLLFCWVPVWLAFWPGHFSADSLTQFYSYYNEDHSTHHPLIHTLVLGACLMLGIDLSPEGYATNGLALYCGIQMVVVAGCVAYACWWMKRRGVPVWARLIVTLLFALNPFYAPWTFYSQKDVIFGVLVMVFCLQLVDLWRFGMKPLRLISFVLIAVLMMLFRNNGIYALALLIPFVLWWAKGKRIGMTALLAGCMALYIAVNSLMVNVLDAEKGSNVEILSVPLQQIARTLKVDPDAVAVDTEGVIETLYWDVNPADAYHEMISDPVKWPVDYELLDENIPGLLSLWFRMGAGHLKPYAEAFLIQNQPYLLPYSEMLYHFDFSVNQIEWFPIEQTSFLPQLRAAYETYDQSLRFLNIPGTHLFADAAFYVWLCIAGFGYACYRQKRGLMMALGFLLAIWITCLLGPVAIMRYMLGLFYTVPVLIACLLIPQGSPFEEK
ncbi:MAG: hypothetical protein E7319_00530 [Clostridiales bacterium]|nr:hypothetical protein [Clostridiales bacterium]